MNLMIRLRYSVLVVAAGIAAAAGGCADRAMLTEPVPALSGPYLLDTGDRLRVVVYDQPSLTNIYEVDQSGRVSMPLIADVDARGATTDELAQRIEARLATAYLREPDVTVEVSAYRPFFVLGEVQTPGQFAYVPGITAETAIAMAGGFSDRANKRTVRVSRTLNGKLVEARVRVIEPIRPGDTIYVPESLF
jgi:polysaccharide export outer membrane protein